MTPTFRFRPSQALVLVAVVATLALPALALGGSSSQVPAPDWFERYAAAHPFGNSVASAAAPASHQRSPDTRDAASVTGPVEVREASSFDWGDARIGALAAATILGLVSGSMLVLTRIHRRGDVEPA